MATLSKSTAAVPPKQNMHSKPRTFSSAVVYLYTHLHLNTRTPAFSNLLPTWSDTFHTVPRDIRRQVEIGSRVKFVRKDDKEQKERIQGFVKEPPKPWTVFEERGINARTLWSSPPCRGRSRIRRRHRQLRKSAQGGRSMKRFARYIGRIRRVTVIGVYR